MPHPTRVALITGCGKPVGIGNSTARALAAKGIAVVVSDLRPTGVANEFNRRGHRRQLGRGRYAGRADRKAGGTASTALGDVSQEADASRMVEEVLARYGRLDILVNNAGAPQGADRNEIENVPVAAWDLTMGVNAKGAFLMSRAAVPAMRQARWGRIVSVRRRRPSAPAPNAPPMPPRRRRSSASPNRWRSTWRPSASRSMPCAPARSAPRARSAPTAANTATTSKPASASAPRRSRSAASANPTKSPRCRLSRLRRSRLRHRPSDRRRRRMVAAAADPERGHIRII